jgi:hypothetical protein
MILPALPIEAVPLLAVAVVERGTAMPRRWGRVLVHQGYAAWHPTQRRRVEPTFLAWAWMERLQDPERRYRVGRALLMAWADGRALTGPEQAELIRAAQDARPMLRRVS